MSPRHPSARKRGARIGVGRFFEAARRWEAAVVVEALARHPELARAVDRHGKTALHLCASSDAARTKKPVSASVATARALLKAGAELNAEHRILDGGEVFPARAVWHAIARGRNRALARFLLSEGATPDHCLWAVVWNDDVVTARLLGKHGADLNLRFHGETPLLYATRLRRTRMVRWLLEHGADPNIGDHEGRTPLLYAVRRRYSVGEIAQLLRHGADPAVPASDGTTPLQASSPTVRKLLSDAGRNH